MKSIFWSDNLAWFTLLWLQAADLTPHIWHTEVCQLSLLLLIDYNFFSQSIRRSFIPFCAFRKERRRPLVDDICVYILHIYFSRDTLKSKKYLGFLQPRDWLFFVLSQNLFRMKLTMVVNLETVSRERHGAKMINHIFRHNYSVLFEKIHCGPVFLGFLLQDF